MPWTSDARTFLRENIANFKHTGSMVPSSNALGRALTRYVREPAPMPRRVLEVGPGTGPVTRHICAHLAPGDTLDLCELSAAFVEVLRRRLREETPFRDVASRVEVHHCPIENLPQGTQYDLIVSGLPLNNFEVHEVEHIIGLFRNLLKPTGTLSFFEYIAMRPLRALVSNADGRRRIREVKGVLDQLLAHEVRRDHVWVNFPPAYAHHVRFSGS